MCLIFTIIAAAVFGVLYFIKNSEQNPVLKSALKTTALSFGAAALMWCVDGVASVMEGESFFDISAGDAVLGVIIIALGLVLFAAVYAVEKRKVCKVAK